MRMTGHPVAVVLLMAAASLGVAEACAEPLDKESCAKLQGERTQLLTPEMQAALERGPDWVKKNLDEKKIERVRQFLSVEEQIQFRCRGGGVDKRQIEANAAGASPWPLGRSLARPEPQTAEPRQKRQQA